jgi:hypothetical protein
MLQRNDAYKWVRYNPFTISNVIREHIHLSIARKYSKTIPVIGRGVLLGSEMSRISHSLGNGLTDGCDIFNRTRGPRSTHQKDFLVLNSFRGRIIPRAIMRLEGLRKLETIKSPHLESNPRPSDMLFNAPSTALHIQT